MTHTRALVLLGVLGLMVAAGMLFSSKSTTVERPPSSNAPERAVDGAGQRGDSPRPRDQVRPDPAQALETIVTSPFGPEPTIPAPPPELPADAAVIVGQVARRLGVPPPGVAELLRTESSIEEFKRRARKEIDRASQARVALGRAVSARADELIDLGAGEARPNPAAASTDLHRDQGEMPSFVVRRKESDDTVREYVIRIRPGLGDDIDRLAADYSRARSEMESGLRLLLQEMGAK